MNNINKTYIEDKSINPILQIEDVNLAFGGVVALQGIHFSVTKREIRAIIGPNGAGKSSLLNCINGIYKPDRGAIYYDDKHLGDMNPAKIAKLGIARTFQNLSLFGGMDVLGNLMSGRTIKMKSGLLQQLIRIGPANREEIIHREAVEKIIEFLELEPYRRKPVGALPYGLQKRVDLGRALAMEPKILLLDEPMAGMNIEEKQDMSRFILDVNDQLGTTIVLIEHDIGVVMDLSDQIVVLDYGQQIANGAPSEIAGDPNVIRAYLGEAKVSSI